MKSLLVYIPSFNRYEFLIRQISTLITSIENNKLQNVRIIVRDNASTDHRYLSLNNEFTRPYIKFRRNKLNVGIAANIIKGFEEGSWDYIWILSDDDNISDSALSIIRHEVNKKEYDLFFLNCEVKGSESLKDGDEIFSSMEYFEKFSMLSMMGFISANVYSSKIKQHIELMYLYAFTLFPQVAGVIKMTQQEHFSVKCIGDRMVKWTPGNRSYSHIVDRAYVNALCFTEIINCRICKKKYKEKYLKDFGVSHYISVATKSKDNVKKAIFQVGPLTVAILWGKSIGRRVLKQLYATYRNALQGLGRQGRQG